MSTMSTLSVTWLLMPLYDRNIMSSTPCTPATRTLQVPSSERCNKNFLVIELELSEFMKVHSVFHITLLSHVTTDSLPGQCQELWEPVITENSEWAWYIIRIFNSKVNQCFNSPLLKYYVEWEGYFPTWEPFYLVNNCQQALNEYHAAYSAAEELHVHPLYHFSMSMSWRLVNSVLA